MKRYLHVIWDWNGTILDDARATLGAFNDIAPKYGADTVPFEQYIEEFGFPVIDFYKRHGFDFDRLDFGEIGAEFMDAYNARLAKCAPHSGAVAAIKALRAASAGQSVLSARDAKMLSRDVARFGLGEFFVRVDGISDIYAGSKTALAAAHLKALNVAPERVLMVGDTLHDKDAADAMGADCALVACGCNSRARLEKSGAMVFDTHAQLLDFILGGF